MNRFFAILAIILFFTACKKTETVTDPRLPLAPNTLQGSALSSNQIALSWKDNSTNETGFKVQRKTGAAAFTDIATLDANTISYTDIGLMPSTA